MVNYNNGKIYKLECLTTGLIYIGSTTKHYLSERMSQHKYDYEKYKKGEMHYISSFDILENDNYIIGLLDAINCNTKDELLAREGYYIKTIQCVNKHIVGRTKKEYRQDNIEEITEKRKQHYQENKEKNNRNSKNYYNDNKKTIKEWMVKRHLCECGSEYTNRGKSVHLKSKKHQTFFNNQI